MIEMFVNGSGRAFAFRIKSFIGVLYRTMYDVHVNQVRRVQVQIFFWYRDFKALTALNNLVDQVLCFRPKQFFVVYKEIIHAYMST